MPCSLYPDSFPDFYHEGVLAFAAYFFNIIFFFFLFVLIVDYIDGFSYVDERKKTKFKASKPSQKVYSRP